MGIATDAVQIACAEDGMAELQAAVLALVHIEWIAGVLDKTLQRHHHLLPQRVDGWVGHLGEHLFEIVEQQLALVG